MFYVKCRALAPGVKGKTGYIWFGAQSIASTFKRQYMLYQCAPVVYPCIDFSDAQYWKTNNLVLVRSETKVNSLWTWSVYHAHYMQDTCAKLCTLWDWIWFYFAKFNSTCFFGYLRVIQIEKSKYVQRPSMASWVHQRDILTTTFTHILIGLDKESYGRHKVARIAVHYRSTTGILLGMALAFIWVFAVSTQCFP